MGAEEKFFYEVENTHLSSKERGHFEKQSKREVHIVSGVLSPGCGELSSQGE